MVCRMVLLDALCRIMPNSATATARSDAQACCRHRNPRVCAPPRSTDPEKIGIKTVYGMPTILSSARKSRTERIGADSLTYCQPSRSPAVIGRRCAAGRRVTHGEQ